MFKWFGLVNYTPHTKVAEFATYLKDGRLMGSECADCGHRSFPPRADCADCMSEAFEFIEVSGRGTVHTFTTISAAPSGFEQLAPYRIGLVDLEEGGRALAWFGDTLADAEPAIGMQVQIVPRMAEDSEAISVYYTFERPGTTWPRVSRRS